MKTRLLNVYLKVAELFQSWFSFYVDKIFSVFSGLFAGPLLL